MKVSCRLDLFGKIFFVKYSIIDKPHTYTIGIASRCKDNQHVVFLDWDCVDIEIVKSDICYIQNMFNLGNFYIFKSSQKPDSYHAICLTKVRFGELTDIHSHTTCDYAFRFAVKGFSEKAWVLRCVKKGDSDAPIFIEKIKSFSKREKSLAHAIFLKEYYGIDIKTDDTKYESFDKEKEALFTKYLTSKCKKV